MLRDMSHPAEFVAYEPPKTHADTRLRRFVGYVLFRLGYRLLTTGVTMLPPEHPTRIFNSSALAKHRDRLERLPRWGFAALPWTTTDRWRTVGQMLWLS
jgi:hypothetical protein